MQWAQKVIEKKLEALGSPVRIGFPDHDVEAHALIIPSGSTFEPARKTAGMADGYIPPGSYEYYGPTNVDITEARTVSDGRVSYLFRRKELFMVGGIPLYWWGILVQGGKRDDRT